MRKVFLLNKLKTFVLAEREKLDEADKNKMTISLRIDKDIKMGRVTDLKQASANGKCPEN